MVSDTTTHHFIRTNFAILGQKFKTEMGTSLAEGHVAGKPNGWRLSEWVFSVMTWWWQSVMEVFLWVIYMNIRYILVNVLGCSLFIVFGGLILYQVSNQFRTSSRLVCAVISMNTEKLPRNTTPLEKLGKGPGVQDDRRFFGYPKVEMSIFRDGFRH